MTTQAAMNSVPPQRPEFDESVARPARDERMFLQWLTSAMILLVIGQTLLSPLAQAGEVISAATTLGGVYDVFPVDRPARKVTSFVIDPDGTAFTIRGIGQNWSGRGKTDGKIGYYDWQFVDGRRGRTDFAVGADGALQCHVIGV